MKHLITSPTKEAKSVGFTQVVSSCTKLIFAAFLLLMSLNVVAQTETLSAGSYIINMGVVPQTQSNALKPYGLIYDLLKNYNVPIKWVISQTKAKDGADFTYNGVDYKGGTFIIRAEDRNATVNSRIAFFGVTGTTTTSPLTVNVTFTLTQAPKWTLDVQNGSIAANFFSLAGVPSTAYNFKTPSELTGCDEIYVMPHADATWAYHGPLLNWVNNNHGSFWGGCRTGSNIENLFNPANTSQQTNFLSNNISTAGNALVPFGNHADGTPPYIHQFPSSPAAQYMGITDDAHQNGSEQIYLPVLNGSWRPSTQIIAYDPTQQNVPTLSSGPASAIVFGRAFGDNSKGFVMYEGGHNISGTNVDQIAAQRAFWNFSLRISADLAVITSTITGPSTVQSGNSYNFSVVASSSDGAALTYQWTSSCGGTFSNPNGATTNFVPPVVTSNTSCTISVTATSPCGRSVTTTKAITVIPGTNLYCSLGGINIVNLTQNLFVFTDGSSDANWQAASKGYIGDVLVNGISANLKTSGTFPYAGTISTNDATLGAWATIVSNNAGQAFGSVNQTSKLTTAQTELENAFSQINALPVTAGYASTLSTSLDGLNTQNGIAQTIVINITSGFSISSKINITGDANDVFILRWDTDAIFSNGYNGLVKFQSGGAIVPMGGLTARNFIHVAGDIDASGGGTTPPAPYPQGPRTNNGTGSLISGGADFDGGGFFTGYWLTTGAPTITGSGQPYGQTQSLSNAIFVGGWYSKTTKFSMTSGTSGVYLAPTPCTTYSTNPDFNSTFVNVSVTGNVNTNDVVPSGTTYGTSPTLLSSPSGSVATLTMNSNGTYSFTANKIGVYTYDVPVCVPGQSAPCPTTKLVITVLDARITTNAPVANVDIATTNFNTPVTLKTLANDAAGNANNNLVPGSVTVVTAPLNGTTSVNALTGDITYTPNAGFIGSDTLKYQVCDNQNPAKCATALQIITVKSSGTSTNTTTAADDYKITAINTPATGNVKTNDVDAEGNTQTVTAQTTTVAGKGTLVLNTDGTYTFTPVNGFTGPVDFAYTTCDNGIPQACASATLHILVKPMEPSTNPDFNSTFVNVAVPGNVSTNDNVPAGTTYGTSPALLSSPSGSVATLTMNSNGTYSFTANTIGVYTYDVPVCVPGQSAPCPPTRLVITVLGINSNENAPVANVDIATTNFNTAVTLKTLANDAAGNPGNSLVPSSITVTVAPKNGTAAVNTTTGDITYTPTAGFVGNDTLTYQVCDNQIPAKCATALQIITVKPSGSTNNTTTAADDYKTTLINTATSGNVKTNDSDAEGNTQTVTAQTTTVAGKGTLVLNTNGTYTFTPVSGFTGPVDYVYTTCDNGVPQACASATLHILVKPIGDLPDLTPRINLNPNNVIGPATIEITAQIGEIANVTTNGSTITLYVDKLNAFTSYNFNPTRTTNSAGQSIQNNLFTVDFTSNPDFIIVTTNAQFKNSSRRLTFTGTFNPGQTKGTSPVNIYLLDGSGGENVFSNNVSNTNITFSF